METALLAQTCHGTTHVRNSSWYTRGILYYTAFVHEVPIKESVEAHLQNALFPEFPNITESEILHQSRNFMDRGCMCVLESRVN
jgi:hypothetical protein